MQFTATSDTLIASESVSEDDVDRLYQKLEKLEAPADTMKQILARISKLPASQRYRPAESQPDAPEQEQTDGSFTVPDTSS
jgi:hypothetical protein